MDMQRVDHYLKQHGGATYGPCYETNRTETQQQHANATDGPFYEAKRKNMYHFMKQNRNARDGPFYEAKLHRQRNGYTILCT